MNKQQSISENRKLIYIVGSTVRKWSTPSAQKNKPYQNEVEREAVKAIQDYVNSIIGEDEPPVPYTHRGFADLTETSLNEATENVQRSARNQLRAEQRARLKGES